MENEPEVLAADILSEIITDIKASRPTTSTGESTTGFVFCMQVPGFMVSPKDFSRPWSPIGGAPTDGPPAMPGATTPPPPANERVQRAQKAAHNTFKMFDEMLMVRDDGRTETYSGGGRSLSFQYKVVLDSMEALPVPDRPAEQQARIDAAHAVLYTGPDETEKTPLLKTYLANQLAWAVARGEFVKEQVRLLKDPSFADMAPMLLEPFRVKAEQAREQFLTQGAEKVEAAQATLLSLGVPLGQGTIASARERFDDWEVTLLGGVGTMPYTFVLPSEWAQIESQDIGWTKIKRESGEYRSHFEQHGSSLATGEWAGGSSSSSGSAGLSVFGFGFGGSYSEGETHSSSSFSNTANDGTVMTNDAKDLSIEMEYGLCKIARPWLVTDIFHMPGWFLRGAKKGAISTGNLSDQIGDEDRKIPMIPTHFLVIRNVKIRAGSWGNTQNTLNSYWSNHGRSDSSFGSSISGDASIPIFSCLSLTGGYSHSDSEYKGDFRDEAGSECRNDFGSYFENDELVINGAQVVGMLGEIVPLCPAEDDPAIGNG
ncbi:hypothetical protein ACIHJG_35900 [Streptomyces sp. NPDC052415]|uniref:hypothetical protein n=1 Tax=Streptomyces sp. NPDC052415 TaxID=3365690 RepID=UPI0037D2BCBB